MKKRCLNAFAAIYVSFAIVIAHSALAPVKTAVADGSPQGCVVASMEVPAGDNQRLYQSDPQAEDTERTRNAAYTVTIWTASWCSQCPAYKAKVQPALLKLGYTVVVKDWDKDSKERPQLRAVPAACIHYEGKMIYLKAAVTVDQIDKFVEDYMPDTDGVPEDIY